MNLGTRPNLDAQTVRFPAHNRRAHGGRGLQAPEATTQYLGRATRADVLTQRAGEEHAG